MRFIGRGRARMDWSSRYHTTSEHPGRVLVVGDRPQLTAVLSTKGHLAFDISNIPGAFRLLRLVKPDLLIVDCCMTNASAVCALLDYVRRNQRDVLTWVVSASSVARDRCVRLGVDRVFEGGTDEESELEAAISSLL